MNARPYLPHDEVTQNRIGLRIAARLSAGAQDLPHEVRERLRAAREQALARQRRATPALVRQPAAQSGIIKLGPAATLSLGGEHPDFWNRLGITLFLAVLVAGLLLISHAQNRDRAMDVADVDAALLTDELPPQAYADPGFLQFLKARNDGPATH